jgi:hypothetical protein
VAAPAEEPQKRSPRAEEKKKEVQVEKIEETAKLIQKNAIITNHLEG